MSKIHIPLYARNTSTSTQQISNHSSITTHLYQSRIYRIEELRDVSWFKCAFENLPQSFTLDVTELDTGDNILIRDLDFPADVKCFLDPRVPVVGVIKAK